MRHGLRYYRLVWTWMLIPLWALILCIPLKYIAGCRAVGDSGTCDRFGATSSAPLLPCCGTSPVWDGEAQ
jgi:hypothetical protein